MTVNTLGSPSNEIAPRTIAASWVWPFVPIGISSMSLAALVKYRLNHGMEVTSPLQKFYAAVYDVFGFAPAMVFFLLTLTWGSIWFATGVLERPWSRALRLLAMSVMLGTFLNLGDGAVVADAHKGTLGAALASVVVACFGYWPGLVMVFAITFAAFVLATDFFFSDRFERLSRKDPPTDLGVESAVTDHLRALGDVVAAGDAAKLPTAVEPAPVSAAETVAPAAFVEPAAAAESTLPLPPPRRSWSERAAERAARRQWSDDQPAEPVDRVSVGESLPEAPPESRTESSPVSFADVPAVASPPTAPDVDEMATGPMAAPGGSDLAPDPTASSELTRAAVLADTPAAAFAAPAPEASPALPVPEAPPAETPAPAEPVAAMPEPVVAIPRPAEAARQQSLFSGLDDTLLQDAIEVVTRSGRANASLLQRKLRIDYPLACDLLAALAARGVIAPDGDPLRPTS